MKEGYKEKRAELVISRILPLGGNNNYVSPSTEPSNVVNFQSPPQPSAPVNTVPESAPTPTPSPSVNLPETSAPGNYTNEELDDIPFMRPIYSKHNLGKILYDSWELAVNSYWDRIKP